MLQARDLRTEIGVGTVILANPVQQAPRESTFVIRPDDQTELNVRGRGVVAEGLTGLTGTWPVANFRVPTTQRKVRGTSRLREWQRCAVAEGE